MQISQLVNIKFLLSRGVRPTDGFEEIKNIRIINFLLIYSGNACLLFSILGYFLDSNLFSLLSLGTFILIGFLYFLNGFGKTYLNLIILVAFAPWLLLSFTYNFGNVGIEYYLLSSTIIISFILGKNKKLLFALVLYLMLMLLLDKIIEGYLVPKTPFIHDYALLTIRYLNIILCLIEVLIGIYIYYVELNTHISIIESQQKELERMNKDIVRKNFDLERHNKIRNKILSIIAHDFRGPLNTLKGSLPLLNRKELSEEEKGKLIIENQTRLESTSNLLEMLLSWAKSQYEGAGLKIEKVNITECIKDNVNLYKSIAEIKQIEVEKDLEPNIIFDADKNMINLIIRNLLANAIKYSFVGGKVTISLKKSENTISMHVIDRGTGIHPHDIDRLFGIKHYTKHGTAGEPGSGLGLLLVKESIEANHGRLEVNSMPENGSVFSVIFNLVS